MAKPVKLCVTNQKGGVGKTTIAINAAGALNERGHDVLFIDVDPQGNATEDLGMREAYDAEPPTLLDCLTEPDQRDAVEDLIREHAEMDLIPSNIDMTVAEHELTLSRRSGEQLDILIRKIEDDYDYVIVDSPPNLGHLTDNAIYATQNVLIPALAESTSKRAFELLWDHIELLESDYEIAVNEVGVVANRIDVRKNQAQEMLEWINDAFGDVPVWHVRERADIQRSLEEGVSLLESAPECDMCDVFRTMAIDIEEQFDHE